MNQSFRRRIVHLGITPDQFTALRWLIECDEGITQKRLTDLMASDPNTVASLLKRMTAAGLVDRKPHAADRRANRLRITAKGKRKYTRARDVALALQTQVLQALPARERDRFLKQLEAVATACSDALVADADA